MQVSQQPSLMQALARLVQPPAEQPRPLASEPRGPQPSGLAASSGATGRPDQTAERAVVNTDPSTLNRLAPRGSYLNIVV